MTRTEEIEQIEQVEPISILLISCYELGHQPIGLAMPLGFLREAGYQADTLDISVAGFPRERVKDVDFIGISVPMHTALRIGVRVAQEIRNLNPRSHICFYGLYASLNADYLLETVADSIIGGEYEPTLLALIKALDKLKLDNSLDKHADIDIVGVRTSTRTNRLPILQRIDFPLPERSKLMPLQSYARLEYQNQQQLVGYVEASRGCLHHCTHCPIPPIYNGRFFVVQRETVLADIRALVAEGARHITFGDPDFLNGPTHALRIARALHAEFPQVTFDFTAKVEHIIKHQELFNEFSALGCLFIVSAVESFSDLVLAQLEKNHTHADIHQAFEITRKANITLRPSFVAFTPWTTIDDYLDMLEFVRNEQIIDQVDPIQYAIRLLIPPGSLILANSQRAQWLGPLVQESFTYQWQHPDKSMDQLHAQVSRLVEQAARKNQDIAVTFNHVCELANKLCAEREIATTTSAAMRTRPPRLTEAWFC